MVDIHDDDIQLVENEIMMTYETSYVDYAECDCLLSLRRDMINKRVMAHQEEILPDIIAFNDALTEALRDMYNRAHRIWESIQSKEDFAGDLHIKANCFLGYEYPKLHPIQGEDRQELWEALCDSGWNKLYKSGVTFDLNLPDVDNKSFDSYIGMDCPPPNWNEGLDKELTKDLHLTQAFHYLFDHTKFAITDFIYVRNFETETHIEIDKSV